VDMMVDGEAHGPSVRTFARRTGRVMSIAMPASTLVRSWILERLDKERSA